MLRNLSTLVTSTVLALAIAELALRAFGAFPVAYPPTPRWPELYAAHPEYGYALRPSRVTRYRYPDSTTAFIPDNPHYAPAGHAIVAEALAALVDRMLPREGRPAR